MPLDPTDVLLLKKPFGTLIAEEYVTKQHISFLLHDMKTIITVGDATTERLVSFGIIPQIAVIDGMERRSKHSPSIHYYSQEISCINPAGTISKEAVDVLEDALKAPPPVRVKVLGEEDLLTLPLLCMAPQGSAVLYGQPLEGLVLVKITAEKQKQAKALMNRICSNEKQSTR